MKLTARYTGISGNLENEFISQLVASYHTYGRRGPYYQETEQRNKLYHTHQAYNARIFLFTTIYNSNGGVAGLLDAGFLREGV